MLGKFFSILPPTRQDFIGLLWSEGEADAEINVSFLCGLPSPVLSHFIVYSSMQKGNYQTFSLLGNLVSFAFLGYELIIVKGFKFS